MSNPPPPADDTAPATEEPVEKKFNNGWTREVEELMAEWSDKAACYRWMHEKTERAYNRYNQFFTIPVIILSTLTGTANFGLNSMVPDPEQQKLAQAVIGGVGLLTGIISTVANFLRYAQGSEANRGAAISWGKFQRLIAIELSINPDERSDCMYFLKLCRTELDRLIEQSPPVPTSIINEFKAEFKRHTNIRKPEITGEIHHTTVFDGSDARMTRMAADSALILQTRHGVVKQLVLDDLEDRIQALIDTTMKKRAAKVTGPQLVKPTVLQERIVERKKEIEQVAMGGVVRAMKERLAAANQTIGVIPSVPIPEEAPQIEIVVSDLPGSVEEEDGKGKD